MAEKKKSLTNPFRAMPYTKNRKTIKTARDFASNTRLVGMAMAGVGGFTAAGTLGLGTLVGAPLALAGAGLTMAGGVGVRAADKRSGVLDRGAAKKRAGIKEIASRKGRAAITRKKSAAAKKSDGVRDAYTTKKGTFVAAKALTLKQRRPTRKGR